MKRESEIDEREKECDILVTRRAESFERKCRYCRSCNDGGRFKKTILLTGKGMMGIEDNGVVRVGRSCTVMSIAFTRGTPTRADGVRGRLVHWVDTYYQRDD